MQKSVYFLQNSTITPLNGEDPLFSCHIDIVLLHHMQKSVYLLQNSTITPLNGEDPLFSPLRLTRS